MRPPSPAGGPTHTSIVSYTLHWLLNWGRRLTQTFFKFYHTVACTRRRTGECGKRKRIRQFLHPLRSTVTRLITAPCKSSSGRRKLYLVLQSCLFYVPNPDLHTISLARHSLATDARALNLKGVYCAFTAKQSASQMLLF